MEIARDQAEKSQTSCSNSFKEVWQKLWKLRVQPRDKVFLWRAYLEALPTHVNLYKSILLERSDGYAHSLEGDLGILRKEASSL